MVFTLCTLVVPLCGVFQIGAVAFLPDLSCKMQDLTHFLLPSSRLPTDVTFMVGEYPVSAHKGLLAAAHPFFDIMFFGAGKESGTSRVKVGWLKYRVVFNSPRPFGGFGSPFYVPLFSLF